MLSDLLSSLLSVWSRPPNISCLSPLRAVTCYLSPSAFLLPSENNYGSEFLKNSRVYPALKFRVQFSVGGWCFDLFWRYAIRFVRAVCVLFWRWSLEHLRLGASSEWSAVVRFLDRWLFMMDVWRFQNPSHWLQWKPHFGQKLVCDHGLLVVSHAVNAFDESDWPDELLNVWLTAWSTNRLFDRLLHQTYEECSCHHPGLPFPAISDLNLWLFICLSIKQSAVNPFFPSIHLKAPSIYLSTLFPAAMHQPICPYTFLFVLLSVFTHFSCLVLFICMLWGSVSNETCAGVHYCSQTPHSVAASMQNYIRTKVFNSYRNISPFPVS